MRAARSEEHTSTGLKNVAVKSTGPADKTKVLWVDVNYIQTVNTYSSWFQRATHSQTLLSSFLRSYIAWAAEERIDSPVYVNISGPSYYLINWLVTCQQMNICQLTAPPQNCGHASFNALPAPCGNQADTYGALTANGTDAGLKGVAVQETPWTDDAKAAVTERSFRRDIIEWVVNLFNY